MLGSTETKNAIKKNMCDFIREYREENELATNWKEPLVGFADANGDYIQSLREIVSPTHYLPKDFLPECTVVISYFLPFTTDVGVSNLETESPSPIWITAYNETNRLFPRLNEHLLQVISEWGFLAANPCPVGMIDGEHIYSNWSQRHIAYAAGLGTFGINNMLITEEGTCGRFYSLITNLPVPPDQSLTEERCLYKHSGRCGLCVKKCPIHALDLTKPFNRRTCASRLSEFEKRLGADACGKCIVGLPCTYNNPIRNLNQ